MSCPKGHSCCEQLNRKWDHFWRLSHVLFTLFTLCVPCRHDRNLQHAKHRRPVLSGLLCLVLVSLPFPSSGTSSLPLTFTSDPRLNPPTQKKQRQDNGPVSSCDTHSYLARPNMRMSDLSVGAADADGVETLLSRKPRSECRPW